MQTQTQTPTPTRPQTLGDLYPAQWLSAADLTKPARVRIAGVETVQVHNQFAGGKEWRVALRFSYTDSKGDVHELSKRLLANRTQCRSLATLAGSDIFRDWEGLTVTLRPAPTSNGRPTIEIAPA